MNKKARELYEKLTELEKKVIQDNFDTDLEIRSHKSDIARLREVVDELKEHDKELTANRQEKFKGLDKEVSATSQRLDDISRQIEDLEKRTEVLEEHKKTADKRVWTVVEKVLVGLIGGAITYLFSSM